MNLERDIAREREAAKALLANIRDVLGDDTDAIRDAIEGETELLEEIGKAVCRVGELAALEAALEARLEQIKARKDRLSDQAERIRTAVCVAMSDAGLRKLELPEATISLKASPPKVLITSEADIPARFWKDQAPKLDRKAISDALKSKEDVPGALLSNQPETIAIRWG